MSVVTSTTTIIGGDVTFSVFSRAFEKNPPSWHAGAGPVAGDILVCGMELRCLACLDMGITESHDFQTLVAGFGKACVF